MTAAGVALLYLAGWFVAFRAYAVLARRDFGPDVGAGEVVLCAGLSLFSWLALPAALLIWALGHEWGGMPASLESSLRRIGGLS